MTVKKKFLTVLTAAFCVALMAALAGCAVSSESETDEATANRAYMSSANTVISQLKEDLEEFSDAVALDDLVTMKSSAKAAASDIEDLSALEPTDTLESIHEEYVTGCEELQGALEDYIDLYSDQKDSKLSDSEYEKRLAQIQKAYDSGISHLEEGDKAAKKLE